MKEEILNTLILAICFVALFGIAELLYHKGKIKVELTRKLVHLGTGFLTLLFPLLLADHRLVLFLCISFALILFLSLRFNLLQSINAIERKSYGSLLYPLSVYLCYSVYELNGFRFYYFYIPILVLAISDPLAALCGKKWPIGRYKVGEGHKTLAGSLVFGFSAALTCFIVLISGEMPSSRIIFLSCSVAVITAIAEAMSRKGFDNLTIPLSALAVIALA